MEHAHNPSSSTEGVMYLVAKQRGIVKMNIMQICTDLRSGMLLWVDMFWEESTTSWKRIWDHHHPAVHALMPPLPEPLTPEKVAFLMNSQDAVEKNAFVEKRFAQRVPVKATVAINGIGHFSVVNMSVGGLFFEVVNQVDHQFLAKLMHHIELEMLVSSPFLLKPIQLKGKIIRKDPFLSSFGYAVLFTAIEPLHESILTNFLSVQLSLML